MPTHLRRVKPTMSAPRTACLFEPYIKTDSPFHKGESIFVQLFAFHKPARPSGDRRKSCAVMPGLAGAEGLEPPTCGFGDRRSTN